jgi:Sensors of blue-light using FAD
MFQLIYSSVARSDFSPQDLKRLLLRARLNNRTVNATGMLLYHKGIFLQALEGDQAVVRRLFNRIEKDDRHHQVSIIDDSTSFGDRRSFGDWSMGFSAVGNAQVVMGFVDADLTEDLLSLKKEKAIDILRTLSQRAQHEPA